MMTIPNYRPPDRPKKPPARSNMEKLAGAGAAAAVVVLMSALMTLTDPVSLVNGLLAGPVVSLLCVFLGSILTIFERTRPFALGFLIASAILIFVTAGVCTVALSSGMVTW